MKLTRGKWTVSLTFHPVGEFYLLPAPVVNAHSARATWDNGKTWNAAIAVQFELRFLKWEVSLSGLHRGYEVQDPKKIRQETSLREAAIRAGIPFADIESLLKAVIQ